MKALSSPTFAIFILYYLGVKKLIDTYYPNTFTELQKGLILYILPFAVKHAFNYAYRTFFNRIKLSPKEKALFAVTSKDKYQSCVEYIEKNYGGDAKLLEKVYYYTGSNLLIQAIGENNIDLVRYLLRKGFNVDSRDCKNGETALIRAIHYNYYDIVKLLLEYNPSLKICHKEMKIIPLNLAVARNKEKLVDLLLNYGAKFDLQSYKNSRANEYNHWSKVNLEVRKTIAKHKCKKINLLMILVFDKKIKIINFVDKDELSNKKLNKELLNNH